MSKWMKVLKVVAVFAVLAALVTAGVSAAWFTDSGSIAGNYVTTGNLTVTVGGGPFTATNLEPGADYVSAGYFYVRNDGTYEMKWRGWLYDVVDPKGLGQYLRVRCIMNPTGHPGNYGPDIPKTLWSNVPFTELMVKGNLHILMDDPNPLWGFAPGHYAWYEILVRVESSAPNAVQDAQVNCRLYIQATQRINTGWVE